MRVTENAGPPAERSVTATARRAQIVGAAIEAIAELGYAQTSFAKIAARAGISSTRLISYHFAGKDDLMRAVVDEATTAAVAFIRPRIAAVAGRAAVLAAYIEANLEFMSTHPAHIRALVDIAVNARTPDGAPLTVQDGPALELLERHFRDGQAEGVFRDFDPRVMAVSLRASIDAAAGVLAREPGADLKAYGTELVGIFERATQGEMS